MIGRGDLGTDVLSLGELLGLLKPDGDGATVDTVWFENPLPPLETIDQRLNHLIEIVSSILRPGLEKPPDVFSGANWYPIPNPMTGGSTPFCIVSSPPSAVSGQAGLGVCYPMSVGALTIEAYIYLPLFRYGPQGATFIAGSLDEPVRLGLYVTSSEEFVVKSGPENAPTTVTFKALKIEADIYLADKAPTLALTFEQLTGTNKPATYSKLQDLLDPDVESWIGEVITQGSYWLSLYIGSSSTTIGQVLAAANFVTVDDQGVYHISLVNLRGKTPSEIALNFFFAGLDALSTLDVPLFSLPEGGIYVAAEEKTNAHQEKIKQYGLRAAANLVLAQATNTNGRPSPEYDLSLGTWFTGETDSTSWMARTAGGTPKPGLSVFLLQHNTTTEALSFVPSFELTSVGINIRGSADAPLVNLSGYTLQGAELRGSLTSGIWDYGFGARLDTVGFPVGPSFKKTQDGSASTNMVAKNLVATNDPANGTGQTNPVNPGFSAELAYVKGKPPLFQLYDPKGAQTDRIWYPLQRRFGPINCRQIGLQIDVTGDHQKDPMLGVLFDGGVQLSALDLELDQLAIRMHLNKIDKLDGYELDLQGLAIALNTGSLEISGGLMKTVDPKTHFVTYDGEALIKFSNWTISAIGSFGSLPTGGTSMFIFAFLSAPLGGPACFFVTGLALGFGYNRKLRLPGETEVSTFPLVAAMGSPNAIGGENPTPAQALTMLKDWVPPEPGEYWLAAGVQFTSFKIINTNALLIVEFGKELIIALLGVSTLKQPQAGETYVYAELDIEVVFAPDEGIFKASAVLAPSSFVLTKQAHLTGGFAAYGWFGTNVHAGDFVFTLGGYHPAFKRPDHYPNEPRVGINWQITDSLAMVGGAYLAITPTAMMAGAALQITYNDGPLSAWLKASADAILFYKPFYLIADAAISIGVSYRLDFLFIHTTITVEIGADFHLWGPPIGGRVHINWYIISFTIGFGAEENIPTEIGWADFKGMLPNKAAQPAQHDTRLLAVASHLRGDPPPKRTETYLTISAAAGLVSTRTVEGLTLWLVRAEQLQLVIGSAVPASKFAVPSDGKTPDLTLDGQKVGMRRVNGDISPENFQSTQTVTILGPLSSDSVAHIKQCMATPTSCTGRPEGCQETPIDVAGWDVKTVTTRVPEALWGGPVPAKAPPNINSTSPTVPATTGLTLVPKSAAITNCTPEMDISKVFEDRTVNADNARQLPLSQTAQPSPLVPAEADSFPHIGTINDEAVVEKRGKLFEALQRLGVNAWTNGSLERMAAYPGRAFADEPLEGVPATIPELAPMS